MSLLVLLASTITHAHSLLDQQRHHRISHLTKDHEVWIKLLYELGVKIVMLGPFFYNTKDVFMLQLDIYCIPWIEIVGPLSRDI